MNLLVCNALIGHKAIGEDGDDGRAVVARVGGDDGEQGGADQERLHLLLGELGRLTDWESLDNLECGGYEDSRYLFGQALELVDFLQK